MRKMLMGAVGLAAGLAMMTGTARADCGEVTITEMNWSSAAVVTAVSKFLMQEGYGCEVNVVPSSSNPTITSIAETGKPDIATEIWVNTAPQYAVLEKEGRIITVSEVLSDGGVEGWWIPEYLVDKHPQLKTLDGILANPELVDGQFHNCPEGWGCRPVNDNIMRATGFEAKGVSPFNHGSGETLATSIASAYADKKPWFGFYWAPTSILGKFPMVKVDMGPYVDEVHACNQTADCSNPGLSDYPTARVVTGVTNTFAEREPEVVELMRHVSFTNAQMGKILAWQEENKASAEEAAVYFLSNFKDVWGNWLNDEARGKLAVLLQ